MFRLYPEIRKRVESRQVKQKEAHDTAKPLRKFNVGDKVFAENFSGTGTRWMPGIIVKITGPLSYLIELDMGKTVHRHMDNVKKRHNSLDLDETTSTSSEQPTNVDISLADTTVNLDQRVEQSSPVSSPTVIHLFQLDHRLVHHPVLKKFVVQLDLIDHRPI